MLALGWWAIGYDGYRSAFVTSGLIASLALAIAGLGFWKQNPWLLGAGTAGVMLFCPSPLGMMPMFLGFALVVVFGFVYMKKIDDTGKKGWARDEA